MSTKEIFSQLLRYFPAGEDARLYTNMRAFGEACLAAGEFDGAEEYADLLLAQDKNAGRQIAAYRIKLFAKLRCRTNEEFRHCAQFSKDLPEYEELIGACAADNKKLAAYVKLADDNVETVVLDRQKRAVQEERERIRREKERAEEAERQRRARQAEQARLRREREEERIRLQKAQQAELKRIKEENRKAAEQRRREEQTAKFLAENAKKQKIEKNRSLAGKIILILLPIILLVLLCSQFVLFSPFFALGWGMRLFFIALTIAVILCLSAFFGFRKALQPMANIICLIFLVLYSIVVFVNFCIMASWGEEPVVRIGVEWLVIGVIALGIYFYEKHLGGEGGLMWWAACMAGFVGGGAVIALFAAACS